VSVSDKFHHLTVTGGADRSIRVWDVKESKCEGEVLDRAKGRASNHADSIYTLQFSSNRVVSGSKDKTLKVTPPIPLLCSP
jgi:WD40 repeat protein